MKGSLYLIINIYGYVAGLEMYGILICEVRLKSLASIWHMKVFTVLIYYRKYCS
ncbi:hypothetical protein RhiirA4_36115 [Rhizophagus irregularis]|uniref:Uncharacterized protein n=1 Tax=Rhizophagus irregularis TaxID=588596 RepID=A0A2I1H2U5_9GLOM|nr:hypothetical protein RhiirA4_36115 [Rhizophagus irregularis]